MTSAPGYVRAGREVRALDRAEQAAEIRAVLVDAFMENAGWRGFER